MRLWLLGSGSKGNTLLIECGDTRVLIDAGFSARRIAERLRTIGVAPESIDALVLTHEHSDHIAGVETALKRWEWPVFGTAGTLAGLRVVPRRAARVHAGASFTIGALSLEAVRTSHDAAEPVGYVATSTCSGMRAAVVTDLGVVTPEVAQAVRHADLLVLESNHDERMLRDGPYPWPLKQRVASVHGHLSNVAAGTLATETVHRGLRQLVLAHLSETNNTPQVALDAVSTSLRKTRWRGAVTAAPQHGVIGPFGSASAQLSLAI